MRKRKRRAEDYPPYLNATSYAGRARHSYARRLEAFGLMIDSMKFRDCFGIRYSKFGFRVIPLRLVKWRLT